MRKQGFFELPRWLKRREPTPAATSGAASAAADEGANRGLLAERDEARAKLRGRTDLLSNVSHELRTSITAMAGMAELLGETPLTDEQRRYLQILSGNGNTLLNLVNDLLDFTRAESGHLQLDIAEFSLIELIEGVAETLAPQAHGKGLELSTLIAEDLPSIALGDSRRIGQILINLVVNAIKFTTAGEVAIVAEREPATPGMIRFSVSDTGSGIDSADHVRIFASYAQVPAPSPASAGSGLGLAIVKELAERMGGRVWLESTPGHGSNFHCSVRIGYEARANLSGEHHHGRPLAGRRVLLMGGAPYSRTALAATLAIHGAEVRHVASAHEVSAELTSAAARPHALLADWPAAADDHAPTLNSLKTMLPAELPLIAMLPISHRNARVASLSAVGVKHYVTKPARRAELLAMVIAAIGPPLEVTQAAASAPARLQDGTPPAIPPLRILLADDAEDNRVLMEAYLRRSGCQLDLASGGAEALSRFKTRRYDVILMDLHMPQMDGYEAIRLIRAWEQNQGLNRTPIIALTAAVLEDSVRESIEAGCDSHVSKPIKRSTLFAALREVISPDRRAAE